MLTDNELTLNQALQVLEYWKSSKVVIPPIVTSNEDTVKFLISQGLEMNAPYNDIDMLDGRRHFIYLPHGGAMDSASYTKCLHLKINWIF